MIVGAPVFFITTLSVHGVRSAFLDAGKEVKRKLSRNKNDPIFGSKAPPSIYFIGKMLWAKGLSSLMELVKYAEESAGLQIKVDMYGDGPEKEEAEAKSIRLGLDMPFHGRLDHAELAMTHKVWTKCFL